MYRGVDSSSGSFEGVDFNRPASSREVHRAGIEKSYQRSTVSLLGYSLKNCMGKLRDWFADRGANISTGVGGVKYSPTGFGYKLNPAERAAHVTMGLVGGAVSIPFALAFSVVGPIMCVGHAASIAVTGKDPNTGRDPEPLFNR